MSGPQQSTFYSKQKKKKNYWIDLKISIACLGGSIIWLNDKKA